LPTDIKHAWAKRIKKDDIDLGKGKRMLVKGGKLNSTYQITVPEDLVGLQRRLSQTVELLIRILPFIAQEDCFALKGGTAINLFVRNMPRLSVDIDLTYLPVLSRAESVLRGCVYEPNCALVSRSVEETFGFAEVRVVSFADLYGGKSWPLLTANIRATS